METKKFFLAGILLLVMLSCCLENSSEIKTTTTEKSSNENLTISVSADKQIYRSGDKLNISVKIESSVFIEDTAVRVYGIYAGRYRIDDTRNVVIYPGKRDVSFTFTTPKCYGCAGISPGEYNITVDLIEDEDILESLTINVTIMQ